MAHDIDGMTEEFLLSLRIKKSYEINILTVGHLENISIGLKNSNFLFRTKHWKGTFSQAKPWFFFTIFCVNLFCCSIHIFNLAGTRQQQPPPFIPLHTTQQCLAHMKMVKKNIPIPSLLFQSQHEVHTFCVLASIQLVVGTGLDVVAAAAAAAAHNLLVVAAQLGFTGLA